MTDPNAARCTDPSSASTAGTFALPPASLVVCSRNRPTLLGQTVASVLAGDEVPSELIVIDQSDEPHPTLVSRGTERGCHVDYRWSRSVGVSRARNEGFAACQFEFIGCIDDDVFVATDWFGTLIRALTSEGERSVVSGAVLPATEANDEGFVPSTTTRSHRVVHQGRVAEGVLYTGNMALRASAMREVGRFDERLGPGTSFPAAEDNDLGFRLLEAGYRIVFEPSAVVYHRAWRTRRQFLPLRWRYGQGRGGFYAKHAGLRDPVTLRWMAADIGPRLRGVPATLRRHPRKALGDVVFSLGVLEGFARWLLLGRG